MKAIKKYAVPFVIGVVAALLVDICLFPLWAYLGWRKPVADWMLAIGLPESLAGKWAMVWVNLPGWLMAIGVGLVIGATRRRSSWAVGTLLACIAFMLTPQLYMLVTEYNVWAAYGPAIAFQTFLWNAVAVPLIVLTAWLVYRRKHPISPGQAENSSCMPA